MSPERPHETISGIDEPRESSSAPRKTATFTTADGNVGTCDLTQVWEKLVPALIDPPANRSAYTVESVHAALERALDMFVTEAEVRDQLFRRAARLLDQLRRRAHGSDYSGSPLEWEVTTMIAALQFFTGWQPDDDHG